MCIHGRSKENSSEGAKAQGQSIEALHAQMDSLNMARQYQKGMKCCDEALKLNPRDPVAWRYKGLMQRNMGEMKNGTFRESQVRGDKEKALTYWSNALDDPWCLYHYGSTLWELNRIRESVPYLKRCLENPPNETVRGRILDTLSFYKELVEQGRV